VSFLPHSKISQRDRKVIRNTIAEEERQEILDNGDLSSEERVQRLQKLVIAQQKTANDSADTKRQLPTNATDVQRLNRDDDAPVARLPTL
jgi:hypothetical protein